MNFAKFFALGHPTINFGAKITCASPFLLKLLSFGLFDDVISRIFMTSRRGQDFSFQTAHPCFSDSSCNFA